MSKTHGRRKLVFQGRLISVFTETRKLPNGNRSNLELISHPGAVLIIPFLTKDKMIFLKQFRPVIDSYLYELPAGTLKKSETALDCARREIIEEAGYSASCFTRLGVIYPAPGYSTERIIIYKAQKLKKRALCLEPDEVIKQHLFSRSQVKKLFRSAKIVDAKSISALVMCGWLC